MDFPSVLCAVFCSPRRRGDPGTTVTKIKITPREVKCGVFWLEAASGTVERGGRMHAARANPRGVACVRPPHHGKSRRGLLPRRQTFIFKLQAQGLVI